MAKRASIPCEVKNDNMQEKVVYFLGAGFSQPLGIPVMSDFISKAKILYNEDRKLYEHFKEVLMITEIAVAKQYFETDLGNIEEILSILDMRAQLEDDPHLKESVHKCITDVISHYTPRIEPHSGLSGMTDWGEHIFGGKGDIWNDYGEFVASLYNLGSVKI